MVRVNQHPGCLPRLFSLTSMRPPQQRRRSVVHEQQRYRNVVRALHGGRAYTTTHKSSPRDGPFCADGRNARRRWRWRRLKNSWLSLHVAKPAAAAAAAVSHPRPTWLEIFILGLACAGGKVRGAPFIFASARMSSSVTRARLLLLLLLDCVCVCLSAVHNVKPTWCASREYHVTVRCHGTSFLVTSP